MPPPLALHVACTARSPLPAAAWRPRTPAQHTSHSQLALRAVFRSSCSNSSRRLEAGRARGGGARRLRPPAMRIALSRLLALRVQAVSLRAAAALPHRTPSGVGLPLQRASLPSDAAIAARQLHGSRWRCRATGAAQPEEERSLNSLRRREQELKARIDDAVKVGKLDKLRPCRSAALLLGERPPAACRLPPAACPRCSAHPPSPRPLHTPNALAIIAAAGGGPAGAAAAAGGAGGGGGGGRPVGRPGARAGGAAAADAAAL